MSSFKNSRFYGARVRAAQKEQFEATGNWFIPAKKFAQRCRMEWQDFLNNSELTAPELPPSMLHHQVDYGDCGLPAWRRKYRRRIAMRIALIAAVLGFVAYWLL